MLVLWDKFLQALLSTISPVIATQKELNLTQLGKLADKLTPLLNNGNVFVVQQSISHKLKTHTDYKKECSRDIPIPIGHRPYRND